jgi:hypothetical protein
MDEMKYSLSKNRTHIDTAGNPQARIGRTIASLRTLVGPQRTGTGILGMR